MSEAVSAVESLTKVRARSYGDSVHILQSLAVCDEGEVVLLREPSFGAYDGLTLAKFAGTRLLVASIDHGWDVVVPGEVDEYDTVTQEPEGEDWIEEWFVNIETGGAWGVEDQVPDNQIHSIAYAASVLGATNDQHYYRFIRDVIENLHEGIVGSEQPKEPPPYPLGEIIEEATQLLSERMNG